MYEQQMGLENGGLTKQNLAASDFDALKPGMAKEEVEAIVGIDHGPAPSHSGMYIPCYYLEDGSRMDLGYDVKNGFNILSGVIHVDKDGHKTNII
jgi:hypothetical protein